MLLCIGQTTQTLSCRMGGHRTSLKIGRKTKLYEHMRLIGLENFKPMILIETLTNCTKGEMQAREDFYIKQFDSVKNGQYQYGGCCEHGRQRAKYIPCGGSNMCEHGRQREQYIPCGGTSICDHGRRRARCKSCGGASICDHGRQKLSCKECNAGLYRCLICNKDFSGRQTLERHTAGQHTVLMEPEVAAAPVVDEQGGVSYGNFLYPGPFERGGRK
jgi:hypothetical protein